MKCSNAELRMYLRKMSVHFDDIADKDFDGQEVCVQCSDLYQIGRTYRECAKRNTSTENASTEWPTVKYPREDWRYEVANMGIILGYDEWVLHRVEAEE